MEILHDRSNREYILLANCTDQESVVHLHESHVQFCYIYGFVSFGLKFILFK